jgi:hypothetical protein
MPSIFKGALLATATVIAATGAAQACRCNLPQTPAAAAERADLAVRAIVRGVAGRFDAEGGAKVTLEVKEAWKANAAAKIVVGTRSTCAYDFRTGQEYLVFLRRSARGAGYETSICDANLGGADAAAWLDWLRRNVRATR